MTFLEKRLKTAKSQLGKIYYQQKKGLPYDRAKIDYYLDQIKTVEEQIRGQNQYLQRDC